MDAVPDTRGAGCARSWPSAVDWRMLARTQRCIFGPETDDRDQYLMLRSSGASPLEALDALLAEASPWEKASTLSYCLPRGLGLATLCELLRRHRIHPLSVAVDFQDRRRAATFLRRLGLAERFEAWIGPGGQLRLRDAQVRALPPGLVLRGWPVISDCPELRDLGAGLRSLVGNLSIERCPQLKHLPDGLETCGMSGIEFGPAGATVRTQAFGHLKLTDCPSLVQFGAGTRIRGQILVQGCPGLQGVDLEPFEASHG